MRTASVLFAVALSFQCTLLHSQSSSETPVPADSTGISAVDTSYYDVPGSVSDTIRTNDPYPSAEGADESSEDGNDRQDPNNPTPGPDDPPTPFDPDDPTGDTFILPVPVGSHSGDFSFSEMRDTRDYTNQYTGRSTSDVFYSFTLTVPMNVTVTHDGSTLPDTYMSLLDSEGVLIASNNDYSGEGHCSDTRQAFIRRQLAAGTYYVVSEGYSVNGKIKTNITGNVESGYGYPSIPSTYSTDPGTQSVIEKVLTFRMAFFSSSENATGKIQARIDQGVSSLSRTVQNFFIDLLPMFTSALLALILMFAANVYVGLVAMCIVPVYFWITYRQARRLKGWRREMRGYLESKSQGIKNIIDSINVIKSFNRESIEGQKQLDLQNQVTSNQLKTRQVSFYYSSIKSFVKQVGTVLVIILTAYLVLIEYPGMSIGKIMYHVMLFSNVIAPITQLQRIFDDVNDALIYAEGFFDILNSDSEVEPSGTYRPEKIRGEFRLSGVDFTYS